MDPGAAHAARVACPGGPQTQKSPRDAGFFSNRPRVSGRRFRAYANE